MLEKQHKKQHEVELKNKLKERLVSESLLKDLSENKEGENMDRLYVPSLSNEKWQQLNVSLAKNHVVETIMLDLSKDKSDKGFFTMKLNQIRENFVSVARKRKCLEITCNRANNFKTQIDFLKALVKDNPVLTQLSLTFTDLHKTELEKIADNKKYFNEFYLDLLGGKFLDTPAKNNNKKRKLSSVENQSSKRKPKTSDKNNDVDQALENNNNNQNTSAMLVDNVDSTIGLATLRLIGLEVGVDEVQVLAPLLRSLTELEINSCVMSQDALIALAVCLGGAASVQELEQLQNANDRPNEIKLVRLNLLNQTIDEKAAKYLGLAFARCQHLKVVDLSIKTLGFSFRECSLAVAPILASLQFNRSLQELIMLNQSLTIPSNFYDEIEQAFANNTTLKALEVSKKQTGSNQWSHEQDLIFLKLVTKNSSIERIGLDGYFGGATEDNSNMAAALLGIWMGGINKNLKEISLLDCRLLPVSTPLLTDAIVMASNLEVFQFSGHMNGLPLLMALLDNPHTILRKATLNFAHNAIVTSDFSVLNTYLETNKTIEDLCHSGKLEDSSSSVRNLITSKRWAKNHEYYESLNTLSTVFRNIMVSSSAEFIEAMIKRLDRAVKSNFVENFEPMSRLIAEYVLFKMKFFVKQNNFAELLNVYRSWEWREIDKNEQYVQVLSFVVESLLNSIQRCFDQDDLIGMLKAYFAWEWSANDKNEKYCQMVSLIVTKLVQTECTQIGLTNYTPQMVFCYYMACEAGCYYSDIEGIKSCLDQMAVVPTHDDLLSILETIKKFIFKAPIEKPEPVQPVDYMKSKFSSFAAYEFDALLNHLSLCVNQKLDGYEKRLENARSEVGFLSYFWQKNRPQSNSNVTASTATQSQDTVIGQQPATDYKH